ncbi:MULTISPECIES: LEA type 2 family protein [Hymenobacter]|uniref:LEA14-like dessication related protein n=1 Tax=Hymenobacter mucosus TaxID=1411120 RepID=A0A238WVI4_9BACT|nr:MULTISPECIES: LEA type 2 family protein [Hymenobacter]SNR50438.1 LEA14-like dessication related protein [Hymenobacter mucosus]
MASQSFYGRHPVVTFLLLALALLLAGAAFLYFRTDKGKELLPTLENASLNVNNITSSTLKAQMKVDLRNQMPVTLRIDSLSYVTRVDGELLTKGAKDRPTVLQGDSVSHLTLPVSVQLDNLKRKVRTSQQDCVDVEMVMNLYTRLPVAGPQKIPVRVTKRVYIPKLPKIEVADVDVKDLGLKNGEAIVSLRVINYNPFPVTVRRVSYTFRVSDDMEVKGVETKDVTFRKRGAELMPIHVHFEPKAMPKVAFKGLFKAAKTPYTLTGSATIAAGEHNPKDMTMNFNSSGSLKDLKEVVKKEKNKE